jgi:hypothetical protein
MLGPQLLASQTYRLFGYTRPRLGKFSLRRGGAWPCIFFDLRLVSPGSEGEPWAKGHGLPITEVYLQISECFRTGPVPAINKCSRFFP